LTCKPSISWFSHHANARYSCAGEYADACKVRFERAVIEMKKKSTRWYAFAFLVITIVVMLVIGFYQSIMHDQGVLRVVWCCSRTFATWLSMRLLHNTLGGSARRRLTSMPGEAAAQLFCLKCLGSSVSPDS
jgi:hypothetical protein